MITRESLNGTTHEMLLVQGSCECECPNVWDVHGINIILMLFSFGLPFKSYYSWSRPEPISNFMRIAFLLLSGGYEKEWMGLFSTKPLPRNIHRLCPPAEAFFRSRRRNTTVRIARFRQVQQSREMVCSDPLLFSFFRRAIAISTEPELLRFSDKSLKYWEGWTLRQKWTCFLECQFVLSPYTVSTSFSLRFDSKVQRRCWGGVCVCVCVWGGGGGGGGGNEVDTTRNWNLFASGFQHIPVLRRRSNEYSTSTPHHEKHLDGVYTSNYK